MLSINSQLNDNTWVLTIMVNYVLVFRDHMIYNYNECDTYIVYKKILYTQNNKPSNNMSCNICIGTG